MLVFLSAVAKAMSAFFGSLKEVITDTWYDMRGLSEQRKREREKEELQKTAEKLGPLVRGLKVQQMMGTQGTVNVAVKTWDTSTKKSIGKGEAWREQRFMYESDGERVVDENMPASFATQLEWEKTLKPGVLGRVKRGLRVGVTIEPDESGGTTRIGVPPVSRKASATRKKMISLEEGEMIMFVGFKEDLDAKKKKGLQRVMPPAGFSVARKAVRKGDVLQLESGIKQSNLSNQFLPVTQQVWLIQGKPLPYSFVYDELELHDPQKEKE